MVNGKSTLNTHQYYMKEALKEAKTAFHEGEVPCGAVVVANEKVIARGHNQTERLNDCTAHAEMIALTAAFNHFGTKYLPDSMIYITLEPCVMCGGALFWSQINSVIYGASDFQRGYSRLSEGILHPKTKVIKGVLQEECSMLMRDFFRKIRDRNIG